MILLPKLDRPFLDLLKLFTHISSICGLLVLVKRLSPGSGNLLASSLLISEFILMEKVFKLPKSSHLVAKLNTLDYSLGVITNLENGKALCRKIGDR